MSADILRRAAKVLRDHAKLATTSEPETPWTAYRTDEDGRHIIRVDLRWRDEGEAMPSGYTVADMSLDAPAEGWPLGQAVVDSQYIALMHPPVALALAEWLDLCAVIRGSAGPLGGGLLDHPVHVARAILREPDHA